ncbi:MAG: divalent-cation tolerance protein CutA [Chlamydiota bacterium]
MILIFWTAATEEEAERLVKELLALRYVACASIFPQVRSFYLWEGSLQKSRESKVLLKTKEEYFTKVADFLQKNSHYDVPEVVALQPERVSPAYQKWLKESL